jgi:hypothetical protein
MRDKERERELSILLASPSSLPRGAMKKPNTRIRLRLEISVLKI